MCKHIKDATTSVTWTANLIQVGRSLTHDQNVIDKVLTLATQDQNLLNKLGFNIKTFTLENVF